MSDSDFLKRDPPVPISSVIWVGVIRVVLLNADAVSVVVSHQ